MNRALDQNYVEWAGGSTLYWFLRSIHCTDVRIVRCMLYSKKCDMLHTVLHDTHHLPLQRAAARRPITRPLIDLNDSSIYLNAIKCLLNPSMFHCRYGGWEDYNVVRNYRWCLWLTLINAVFNIVTAAQWNVLTPLLWELFVIRTWPDGAFIRKYKYTDHCYRLACLCESDFYPTYMLPNHVFGQWDGRPVRCSGLLRARFWYPGDE